LVFSFRQLLQWFRRGELQVAGIFGKAAVLGHKLFSLDATVIDHPFEGPPQPAADRAEQLAISR
jgi:hypothetical protein